MNHYAIRYVIIIFNYAFMNNDFSSWKYMFFLKTIIAIQIIFVHFMIRISLLFLLVFAFSTNERTSRNFNVS